MASRALLLQLNVQAMTQGDPSGLLQNHGNWCGARNSGMFNCCAGAACAPCAADADALLPTAGGACLAACPPVDALDVQCMWHDFCCSAMQHAARFAPSNCTYTIPGASGLSVTANDCACDAGLYQRLVALAEAPSSNVTGGFADNLFLWLTSSWGKCSVSGNVSGCVPFRGAVSPADGGAPAAAIQRKLLAAAGGVGGVAAVLLLLLCVAAAACVSRKRRRMRAAAAAAQHQSPEAVVVVTTRGERACNESHLVGPRLSGLSPRKM